MPPGYWRQIFVFCAAEEPGHEIRRLDIRMGGRCQVDGPYEPESSAFWMELLDALKLAFVACPSSVTAERQAKKTSMSIIAYSMAVGPSSEAKNLRIFRTKDFML